MAEQRWSPSDAELAEALRDLGRQVAYPPTPPLAGAVRARLAHLAPAAGLGRLAHLAH